MGAVLFGLVALIWFGALHQALYDYWAMTLAFGWISGLTILLLEAARREKRTLQFPLFASWMLLVAAGWLSVIHSVDVTTSLWEAWGWTYCMIVFYIVVNCFTAAPNRRRFFLLSTGAVLVPLVWAALQQQIYGSPTTYGAIAIHGHIVWHYGRWEIHATLVNSVVMAGFFLSWSYIFWPCVERRSRYLWIPFAILVCGIMLSRSWTACLCLAAGLAIYHNLLYGTARRRAFLIKLFLLACAGGVLLVFWKSHQQAEGQRYVSSVRLLYWKAAIRMFLAHPLTGIGLGGYAVAFPYFKPAAGENTLLAHGLGWQILAETGLCGVLASGAWLAEFSTFAQDALQKKAWSPDELGLFMTLMTLLAFGMTTIYFDYLLNKLVFVVVAGFLCARMPTRVQWIPKPSGTLLMSGMLITCASFWLTLFRAEQYDVAGDYVQALTLNPRLGDAWAKLADTEKDPARARALRLTAWHWKKDRNFLLANIKNQRSK